MSGFNASGRDDVLSRRSVGLDSLSSSPVLPMIAALFFVLTFLIKALVDDAFTRGDISAGIAYTKYVTAAIACLAALAYALKNGERVFIKEFNALAFIFIIFTAVSTFLQVKTGHFSTGVLLELFKFAIPIILAYTMLNALTPHALYRCMVAVLLVSILGYLLSLSHEGVGVSEILEASFMDSNSASESSTFSGIFLVLTFYFAFFRHKKVWLVLSALFCILTFKRLAIVAVLFALVVSFIAPRLMKIKVPRGAIVALKVCTVLGAFLWTWMLLPEQQYLFIHLFGDTQSHFSMGRSDVLGYFLSSGFESYGYGSANEVAKAVFAAPFEMDLTKIAFELTPLVMVLFVWLFWDVAGDSLWGVVIIGYFMINMITSDSLTSNFCLTLAYMTCGLVTQTFEHTGKYMLEVSDNAF